MKIFKFFGKGLFVFIIFLYFLERKKPEREYPNQENHDLLNISTGVTNNLISSFIVKKTYFVFDVVNGKNLDLLNFVKLNTLFKGILAITLIDLWMYWWHRINHESPLLWRLHKVHHEDESLNTTSAVRFHFLEIIISTFMKILILLPFGIEKKHINIYEKILSSVIFFNHSNIKISPKLDFIFRKFIVSPEMHRTHHSTDSSEANSNYSSVFPYWDIIFKTYTKNPKKRVDFGITDND